MAYFNFPNSNLIKLQKLNKAVFSGVRKNLSNKQYRNSLTLILSTTEMKKRQKMDTFRDKNQAKYKHFIRLRNWI